MKSSARKRVLVVANRTASTPRLLDEVARRAKAEPTEFTLLIPDAPDRKRADWTLDTALPLLSRAARAPVQSLVSTPNSDPFAAVEQAIRDGHFDAVIISTLPRRSSRWLRRDLIRRVEKLGLPVTAVVAKPRSLSDTIENSADIDRAVFGGGGGSV